MWVRSTGINAAGAATQLGSPNDAQYYGEKLLEILMM